MSIILILIYVNFCPSDLSRNWSRLNSKTGGDGSKGHGYSSSRPVREIKHGVQQRDESERDPQVRVGFVS